MERSRHIGMIFVVTAVLGLLLMLRVRHLGDWFQGLPGQLGLWRGQDLPRYRTVLDGSRYLDRVYRNPLEEGVEVFLMAPRSVRSYRDPQGCALGGEYAVTAEKDVPLGNSPVTLIVLRDGEQRQIMCSWIQERGGRTRPEASAFDYTLLAHAVQALRFAGSTLLAPRPVCLVRVFTPISPSDPQGQQARRNVLDIAEMVHKALK